MNRIYIAMFLLWAVLVLWSCSKPEAVSSENSDPEPVPDQEMWNFDVRVTDKGRLEAHLRSGHMVFFNDKNDSYSILNEGVHVDFYDADGNHASTLTADSGHYRDKTQDVKAFRNVVIISDSGVTMNTEAIEFDQEQEMIFTDLPVMITTTQGDSFWGTGFESDPHMNNWKISKLSGIAHTGVDMSPEAFDRDKKKETDVNDYFKPDTLDMDSTIPVEPDSGL